MNAKMFLISVGIFAGIIFAMNFETILEKKDYSADTMNIEEIEQQIHQQVNERRIANGLQPLEYDYGLAALARSHSLDMSANNFFDHVDSDRLSPAQRGQNAGYIRCGNGVYSSISENIAKPYSYELFNTVNRWIDSPLHRHNIYDNNITSEGIGVARGHDDVYYITQNLC